MHTSASPSRRHVALAIQTISKHQTDLQIIDHVAAISVMIDDGTCVIQRTFVGNNEYAVLSSFWATVQPHDLFVGIDHTEDDLSNVRRRSWCLGMQAIAALDLRRYYSHEVVDVLNLLPGLVPEPTPALQRVLEVLVHRRRARRVAKTARLWACADWDGITDLCRNEVLSTLDAYRAIRAKPKSVVARLRSTAANDLALSPLPSGFPIRSDVAAE